MRVPFLSYVRQMSGPRGFVCLGRRGEAWQCTWHGPSCLLDTRLDPSPGPGGSARARHWQRRKGRTALLDLAVTLADGQVGQLTHLVGRGGRCAQGRATALLFAAGLGGGGGRRLGGERSHCDYQLIVRQSAAEPAVQALLHDALCPWAQPRTGRSNSLGGERQPKTRASVAGGK